MTQALALASILRGAGHEVADAWVGLGPGWSVPDYFEPLMGAPVHTFRGPTHTLDRSRERVDVPATVRDAILGLPRYVTGIVRRRRAWEGTVDLGIGFYDAIGGLMRAVGSSIPSVVLGHHYLLFHPARPRLPLSDQALWGIRALTSLTAFRADLVLALSFAELPAGGVDAPTVVPPLLRPQLRSVASSDEGHLLAYAVTPGIANRIVAWQRTRPDVPVHLYVEGGADALTTPPGEGCSVHELDDVGFLRHMATCRAFAGSAGFEALCEAHYLGKKVLAVPTAGQIEQTFNAVDADRFGVARAGRWDDLDAFWDRPPPPDRDRVRSFRAWVDSAPERILAALRTLPALRDSL